ncbi:MAG: metal ABC transporter permease [Hyphomicrobiaceae bacterium]
MDRVIDALLFQAGYNAAVVAIGATLLGVGAGAIGSFLFLRRRALVADAVAHAALPGLATAFLLAVTLGLDGRNLVVLMFGALCGGALGLAVIEGITRATRLGEDVAIGAVISVFFGFGIVLLTVIQALPFGRQAGLENFLLGSTAGLLTSDLHLIAAASAVVVAAALILRQPLKIVAFDPAFARAIGIDVVWIDRALLLLVMAITVIGLRFVGLVLIVALLIIPAASARFWSNDADRVALISAVLGGVAGYLGVVISLVSPKVPTGPVIVLLAAAMFAVSLVLGTARGLVSRRRRGHPDGGQAAPSVDDAARWARR